VLVSGGGTNLQSLIDASADGSKSYEIALVISNKPDVFALERAKKANIKALTISSAGKSRAEFEAHLSAALEENGISLIALAGFMRVLSEDFVKKYDRRMLNIHPSLIPSFCGDGFYGLKVHEEALKRGVKVTGATVHYVNEITDGGEIILQKAVYIEEGDTPEILQKRVMAQAEHIIYPEALDIAAKRLMTE